MSIKLALAAALAGALVAAPATAAQIRNSAKSVVELFTSQGCSSCPPADALFDALGKRPDVVALAYHVDYWDYIGWADTFGAHANSDRQRAYAQSWGTASIYTPQLVVNGTDGVVGSHRDEVDTALQDPALVLPVHLTITADGMLAVDAPGLARPHGAAVWLVTFIDRAAVDVERGENQGRKLTYTQIVTGRQVLGMWDPDAGVHVKLPLGEVLKSPSNGAVILVQEEHAGLPGAILGAASLTE
jgi:hypothetical protein